MAIKVSREEGKFYEMFEHVREARGIMMELAKDVPQDKKTGLEPAFGRLIYECVGFALHHLPHLKLRSEDKRSPKIRVVSAGGG